MWSLFLITLYCIGVVASSVIGGLLPSLLRLTHTRLQLMMSFVGGLMLGVAVLHLLPHAVAVSGDLGGAVWWLLVGLLVMFFLIRFFHVHQHGQVEQPSGHAHVEHGHHDHGHSHAHDEAHGHCSHADHDHAPHASGAKPQPSVHWGWLGLAFGLSLHSLFDGVALGSAVAVDVKAAPEMLTAGLGTFLTVLLHKPLDALAITVVMTSVGVRPALRSLVNAGYALICPLGVALFYLLSQQAYAFNQNAVIGGALAFSAGVFLCIALADILPEVSFHSHDRLALTSALLLGVLLAYGIGYLEPQHIHQYRSPATSVAPKTGS